MTLATAVLFAVAAPLAIAPARAADAAPPDIVRTREGGMLRGTIIESVPNERVEILLPNGQSRTVKMSDVAYAGPASADPGATTSAPAPAPPPPQAPPPAAPVVMPANSATIDTGTVRLELAAAQSGLTFHRKVGTSQGTGHGWVFAGKSSGPITMAIETDHFERLCTAPCAAELPRGTYRLGLSVGDGDVIAADQALDLNGDLRLHGRVTSYAGVRIAGWAIGLGGIALGTLIAITPHQTCLESDTSFCFDEHPYMFHGLAVMTVAALVGAIMAYQPDRAEVRSVD